MKIDLSNLNPVVDPFSESTLYLIHDAKECEVDSESMLLTDILQYGGLNRLFSKWSKDLEKMHKRFDAELKDLKQEVKEDGHDKVNERILKKKSLWLNKYETVIDLQEDSKQLRSVLYKLYKDPINTDIKTLGKPLLDIVGHAGMKDTKWGEAFKTFLFTTVGSTALKALGGVVGHSVGGGAGAAGGVALGAAIGNVAGAAAAKKFSAAKPNKENGFDLKKLTSTIERQMKLIKTMSNISDYKKVLKIDLSEYPKEKQIELKKKIKTIRASVRLLMSLIHVVNRGLIEAC